MITVIGAACFILGLYAGKRRAKGLSWNDIGRNFYNDACKIAKQALVMISSPFKKEDVSRA